MRIVGCMVRGSLLRGCLWSHLLLRSSGSSASSETGCESSSDCRGHPCFAGSSPAQLSGPGRRSKGTTGQDLMSDCGSPHPFMVAYVPVFAQMRIYMGNCSSSKVRNTRIASISYALSRSHPGIAFAKSRYLVDIVSARHLQLQVAAQASSSVSIRTSAERRTRAV